MKNLTLVILLTLSPLSWGEDVWYCVEEKKLALGPVLDDGELFQTELNPKKFTLKYEPERERLAIKGPGWKEGDSPYYLDCIYCEQDSLLQARDTFVSFALNGGRFYYGETIVSSTKMASGTCTKF